ncbi:hypothetical protein FRB90_002746 [Tulasnella sp. 427]|nr:hypothetical protein FRB90_002746 [Tulasnella sp. 427]
MATIPAARGRKRASSVKEIIENIETDPAHHLTGPFVDTPPTYVVHQTDTASALSSPSPLTISPPSEDNAPVAAPKNNGHQRNGNGVSRQKRGQGPCPQPQFSKGLWNDVTSMNWARVPTSSLFLMTIPVLLYLQWEILSPGTTNPFKYLLMIQYPVPGTSDPVMYQKGYGDLAFLAYYVIVFSFIRQGLTLHVLRPLAWKCGIKKEAKLDRFAEQAYAIIYFSTSGALGLWAMYNSPTWYFNGRHYFQGRFRYHIYTFGSSATDNTDLDYPYWKMTKFMKSYYLLQFSYWVQQFVILVLGLEKPRTDFTELVIHHIVTLWLIGWSYLVNLTPIGNAVFITMDTSDIFLAFAKTLNYLGLETASTFAFAFFIGVWSYTRHYLNLRILWDVYHDFDLIPKWAQAWRPETGAWLAPWMKWQIFAPLVLLQLVNIFWYFLILRVLYRAVFKKHLADERSDDEDDGEPADDYYKDD